MLPGIRAVVAAGLLWCTIPAPAPVVTVFAAASLSTAMEDIRAAYERETGRHIRLSTSASSTLARQIESGADAALFISADLEWVDYLDKRHLVVPSSRVLLLGNRLVLIAPYGGAAPVPLTPGVDIARLLGDGRLATGDPAHVPSGRYAREALTSLGAWAGVEHRLVSTDSVRAALVLVERGEVPLGIVYETDARMSAKVRTVGVFPPASHRPIVYPMVIVAGHDGPEAREFYQFVQGETARAVFRSYGFTRP
jgi:molybdate transport system substrate-binding protein